MATERTTFYVLKCKSGYLYWNSAQDADYSTTPNVWYADQFMTLEFAQSLAAGLNASVTVHGVLATYHVDPAEE